MEPEDVQTRIDELGPWVNGIAFDGSVLHESAAQPGSPSVRPRRTRAQQCRLALPSADRVLEVGALEGTDTAALLRAGYSHVTAIEGRGSNLCRAQFVLSLHDLSDRVEWVHADVEELDFATMGNHDLLFCTGLLYHLSQPERFLSNATALVNNLFLQTHIHVHAESKVMRENYPQTQVRGLYETARWLSKAAVLRLLEDLGFTSIQVLEEGQVNGAPSITIAARKAGV